MSVGKEKAPGDFSLGAWGWLLVATSLARFSICRAEDQSIPVLLVLAMQLHK